VPNTTPLTPVSKAARWTGYVMSALPVLAFVMSGVMKIKKTKEVIEGFAKFGYPETTIIPLGITEIVITVLYLVPGTSVLGAILISGYMGGAVATNYRVGEPWWPCVIVGILAWGGLFMREPRLRALIPFKKA
jgi:DoxX-like family